MGFLSQVVRDARPRAAPSLYAGTPMPNAGAPAGAEEAATLARLTPSAPLNSAPRPRASPVPDLTANSAVIADHHDGGHDEAVSPSLEVPEIGRKRSGQPNRSDPETRENAPAAEVFSQIVPEADKEHEKWPEIGSEKGPEKGIGQPVPVKQGRDEVPARATGPRVLEPRARASDFAGEKPSVPSSMSGRVPVPQSKDVPAPLTSPEPGKVVALPDVSAHEGDNAEGPDLPAVETIPVLPQAPGFKPLPERAPSLENNVQTGPSEVRIGQVEIVVQDPPAPRMPRAARPVASGPSPSRFYVRRL